MYWYVPPLSRPAWRSRRRGGPAEGKEVPIRASPQPWSGSQKLEKIIKIVNPQTAKASFRHGGLMEIIRGVASSPARQGIVAGIMTIAQALGIAVIAEGIETRAELEILREAGVQLLQGFLLARPAIEALPSIPDLARHRSLAQWRNLHAKLVLGRHGVSALEHRSLRKTGATFPYDTLASPPGRPCVLPSLRYPSAADAACHRDPSLVSSKLLDIP
jgi:hypothetical protein